LEDVPEFTVYYTDSEFLQVAQWIWDNFDLCSGISLLPVSEHTYQQAPYEDISAEEYDKLLASMPKDIKILIGMTCNTLSRKTTQPAHRS
jgi:hypothetical protein